MGGRASLLMVIGFAAIFGIINLNLARLTNRSMGGMIGYGESSLSRVAANAGAQIGLSMLTTNPNLRNILLDKSFTTGNFKGSGYMVRVDIVPKSGTLDAYVRLLSVSKCTTFVKDSTSAFLVLCDTVEVRLDSTSFKGFCELGWMSVSEGTVAFGVGDTLYGKVHSNGKINISTNAQGGGPRFFDKVTTSSTLSGANSSNTTIFRAGAEERVPTRDFPTDLNDINLSATNKASTRTQEIYVTLKPGTSADNDGYAIISTVTSTTSSINTGLRDKNNNYIWHTVTNYAPGTKLDSIPLSGSVDNVIYTSENVHVSGTLDGSLSIASGQHDIRIEKDIRYENEPDPFKPLSDPVNQTTDMLGLIAYNNIIVSENTANHKNDLYVDGALFALMGKYTAENYDDRGEEGTIRTIGSIAQKTRGAIASPGPPYTGFHKNYKYDTRMSPPTGSGVDKKQPPVFPGYKSKGPLTIKSWWESTRKPFIVDEYSW